MGTLYEDGTAVLRDMAPGLFPAGREEMRVTGFAAELGKQATESVFGRLWGRPGLDRRSRSLVTLGILIALRAEGELQIHLPMALSNGVSREELEEVVYHSAAYAGFPAAATVRRVGVEVLDEGVEPRHVQHLRDGAQGESTADDER